MPPTCLRCGYAGPPIAASTGGPDGCLTVLLLCAGILPGVLYVIFVGTTQHRSCPQCGLFLGTATAPNPVTPLLLAALGVIVASCLVMAVIR